MRKYTNNHEWIEVNGNIGRVGISSFGKNELGQIVFVQLPNVGRVVELGEEVAILESTKAASDIYSPVSGKIIGVNESLIEDISLINDSPEDKGYLYEILIDNLGETKDLVSHAEYQCLDT
tara:strand:- start:369 stop:731 length:363 start_codon:yes stop_codon:yes gene_type:complete